MNDLHTVSVHNAVAVQATALSSLEVACDHCGMFGICRVAGLDHGTARLARLLSRRTALARDAVLFHAGEPFNYLYAVKSGALASVGEDRQGQHKILGFYFPGDILGTDAIESGAFGATVVALEKSQICKLDYQQASLPGEALPAFYRQLIDAMSRRLELERWSSLLLSAKSTEQRLATFLIYLSCRFKARGLPCLEYRLPMTRREMADYLGMAVETVSRTLSGLQKQGLLVMRGRHTRITNPEGVLCAASLKPDVAHFLGRTVLA